MQLDISELSQKGLCIFTCKLLENSCRVGSTGFLIIMFPLFSYNLQVLNGDKVKLKVNY